jgi:hypothetical protein
MRKMSKPIMTFGVAALSLAVAAGPAMAKDKTPKLAHTHLTVKAAQERVTKNDKFKATVVATLRAKKAGLADEPVELLQRDKGATKWVDTGTGATTDANGAASFAFIQAEAKQQYRVVFAGDATYAKSHSGTITIHKLKAATSS